MTTSKLIVIIPIYKKISDFERIVLKHNLGKLQNFKVCVICPDGYIVDDSFSQRVDLVETFDGKYFKDIEGYNKLLRSFEFYSRFANFDYMLIIQLDAIVFSGDLDFFIEKNYDYWGAPWIDFELINYKFLRPVLPFFHKFRLLRTFRRFTDKQYLVGNGGLSLRKIKTHIEVTRMYREQIMEFESHYDEWISGGATSMMEDVFWCLYVPKFYKKYKIAPWKEANTFSMEMNPRKSVKLNRGKLPFGCHAFYKVDPVFIEQFVANEYLYD